MIGFRDDEVTLGLLAGGRGSRMGGRDKAWLRRDGRAQVLRLHAQFAPRLRATLVSANANLDRYALHALQVVRDRFDGHAGPIAGLDALARACVTPWLLTLPVDVVDVPGTLPASLAGSASRNGAFACDAEGPQPLIALWRVDALADAASRALGAGNAAVHSLQSTLDMSPVQFTGWYFGNLNTPADLRAAGFEP